MDPKTRVDRGLKRFCSFACWLTYLHLILEANEINVLKTSVVYSYDK